MNTHLDTPTKHHHAGPADDRPGQREQVYTAFRLFQMALVGLGTALLAINADLRVAIAAPIAWAALIAVLLLTDRRPTVQHERVLVCLDTATAGIVVLLIGLAVGDVTWPWLVGSQVVMAAVFLLRRRSLRMTLAWAAAAWFGVLDGVYTIVWAGLWIGGVR